MKRVKRARVSSTPSGQGSLGGGMRSHGGSSKNNYVPCENRPSTSGSAHGGAAAKASVYWLQWNTKADHFSAELSKLFGRSGEGMMMMGLTDVTLCSGDGHFIQAHKLVLSMCSPFFRRIFLQTNKVDKSSNPVVVLANVKLQHLRYLLQFLYTGESHVPAGELDEFLKIGELFQIGGLSGYIKTFSGSAGDDRQGQASSSRLYQEEEEEDLDEDREVEEEEEEEEDQDEGEEADEDHKYAIHGEQEEEVVDHEDEAGLESIPVALLYADAADAENDPNPSDPSDDDEVSMDDGVGGNNQGSRLINEVGGRLPAQSIEDYDESSSFSSATNVGPSGTGGGGNNQGTGTKVTKEPKGGGSSGGYTCGICFKEFTTRSAKSYHQSTHLPPKYPCQYCSKTFPRRFGLKRHVESVHKKPPS